MTNLAHSPLGPSSADRWLNCPGSVRLTARLPDTSSEYSREGTAAHEVAERCQSTGALPQTFLGQTIEVEGHEIEVDQEMVDGVRAFLEHMNDLPNGVEYNESRVHYERWVKDGFGTLDRAKACGDTVFIRDLKYGKGVKVFARNNAQLKIYAAAFLEEFGWLLPEVKKFNLGIVQPRLEHIDEFEISTEDLIRWMDEVVKPGAKLTEDPRAHLKAGDWCQFCKIRNTCMVRAGSVFKEVVGDFENLDEAIEKTVAGKVQPFMSPEQVSRALYALPQMKAWCKDLEAYAMREAQAGRDTGGWYLTEGRGGNRTWALTERELLEEARAQGIYDPKVLYAEPKLLSPPAAEKVIGKKHPLLQKIGVVVKPPGKPVLAPPGDGRPPLSVDALKEFSDIGNDD